MPRTIESIVDNHHEASRRRAAGQPVWEHHLNIRHLLASDGAQEDPGATGKQVAQVLRASSWAKADVQAHGMDSEVAMCAEEFEDIEDVAHFNDVLDRLYDLADADRTWIA